MSRQPLIGGCLAFCTYTSGLNASAFHDILTLTRLERGGGPVLGKIRRMCPLCWQDSVILVVTMAVVLDLGLLLQPVGADDCHAALLL